MTNARGSRQIGFALVTGLTLAGLLLLAGCSTTPAPVGSKRAASIIITNHTSEEIATATKEVFIDYGYEAARSEEDELVFQRERGSWTTFFYGDWFRGPVWERIRVYQTEKQNNAILVDCDRFFVQVPDDPLFQKERKRSGRSDYCQDLLNLVAERVKTNAASAK